MSELKLESTLCCPYCAGEAKEIMPENFCQWFYECRFCRELIKPKPGDCCVYCSYGTVSCPPVQMGSACCG
ncbi:GDCCVxC domain-containing (seleno)protein [Zhongshania sp.]|uniref:GDCCVxC domain-containing (seleno)protein n=1 Tax=Zhongshania sp. TaxID=1971902 RepID=UPI00356339A5